ncbi:MAG: site-specific integrase [Candidatus Latescibacteria bacterium]|nr:site-specific integrase [Candidatus Latescibacterota bacterium]
MGRLERATRTGLVSTKEIDDWIAKGWIKDEEANVAFPGYAESSERKRRLHVQKADFQQLLRGYEEYALRTSKSGSPHRKTHKSHMSMARQVLSWLESEYPNLKDLTPQAIQTRLSEMSKEYSEWSVYQYLNKLRLLLDQAVSRHMLLENPARQIGFKQPKKTQERRILKDNEISRLLEVSLNHRQYISGCLPTVVRLGLYAGLRDEEMCWLRWEAIDWENRIISIRESKCEETGEVWIPKDYEMRRLDVKEACIAYLGEDRKRQESEGILGPFVMPGGDKKRPQYRKRPLYPDLPQKAFSRMIQAEDMDTAITVYSMRHTYATMALRSRIDIRTLQKRMGHSDLKTTMEYLHYIEPEEHPMDKLPY